MIKSPNGNVKVETLIVWYMIFGDFAPAVTVSFLGLGGYFMVWREFWEEFRGFGGDPVEILEVFVDLYRKDVEFDGGNFGVVIRVCEDLRVHWLGAEVHTCLIKTGYEWDVNLMCGLMRYYGNCWGIEYGDKVFDAIPKQEARPWSEAIAISVRNGRHEKVLRLFRDMQHSSVRADNGIVDKVLQAYGKLGDVREGKQVHGFVIRSCMYEDLAVGNSLITMYCRAQEIGLARKVFDSMKNYNLCSWNSMISGYSSIGDFDEVWNLFYRMESRNVTPDIVTWNCLVSSHFQRGLYQQVLLILRNMLVAKVKPDSNSITPVIQSAIELKLVRFGKEVHCYVIRNGLEDDEYIGTTLIDMYAKSDLLVKAKAVFDLQKNRSNIIAWNSLIAGYSYKGLFDDALALLRLMKRVGITPDIVTWNTLVSGYSLNGRVKDAVGMMNRMKSTGVNPNVVTWTALITGCAKHGKYEDSLTSFAQMLEEGIQPNLATYLSLLPACAGLSSLQKGREIHGLCIRNGFHEDVAVATGLIDMYVNSGSLECASEVFSRIRHKTVSSWNCMIMGFATYSRGKDGIRLFDQMLQQGLQPDAITFTTLLSACKNSGLVDEGWKYFDMMKEKYGLTPTIVHYSCMVDLLGRAGYLDEAWDFIRTMPLKPDASVWGALLSSSRAHKELELGKIAASHLFELEPYNSANYAMMMNLYSISNRWEDVDRVRDMAFARGVQIKAGWSWVDIDQQVHVFTEEEPHPDLGEIYFELYQLMPELKRAGYLPDTECVYQNIDDVEKEKVLLSHPEKLAITYGLIKTRDNSPIRVIKNTRTCSDCHRAAKFISSVRNREILLKDGTRFHHFKQGKCSCHDRW